MGNSNRRAVGLVGVVIGSMSWGCPVGPWGPSLEGDGGTRDAGVAGGGSEDAGAPEVVTTVGSVGRIDVSPDAVWAAFFDGNSVFRASASQACVAHERSSNQPFSNAGTLRVVGATAPADAGAPVTVTAEGIAGENAYYVVLPPEEVLFLPNGEDRVEVRLSGLAPSFPPMPPISLRAPSTEFVDVLLPLDASPGEIRLSRGAPLDFEWVPPADGVPEVVVIVELDGNQRYAAVYCTWPASAGEGHIPGALLGAVREKMGGEAPIWGYLSFFTGSGEEVFGPGSSYFASIPAGFSTLPGQNLSFE